MRAKYKPKPHYKQTAKATLWLLRKNKAKEYLWLTTLQL